MFEENLYQLGLSKEEAQIYLALLHKGSQSAADLAKLTSVKRTYVYAVTESLLKKGLIKQDKAGRGTTFIALSPDNLLDIVETKRLEIEQAKIGLENILPQLKTSYASVEEKPLITYFEGVEGIKKVFQDTLTSKSEILAFVGSNEPDEKLWTWLRNVYTKERVKQQIAVKVIVSTGTKYNEYVEKNTQELRQTKTVPMEKYPIYPEINIYDNKVVMMQYNKNDTLLATMIENKLITETYRSWFNLTWDGLK